MKTFGKMPVPDLVVMVLVTAITVLHDLALVVLIAALVFAWENATRIRICIRK